MPQDPPRVAVVSGLMAAAGPAEAALRGVAPRLEVWHVVDDLLIADTTAAGGATPSLNARFLRLLEHAFTEGARAALVTCTLYAHLAPAAESRWGRPVISPDAAAFAALRSAGFRRVALVSAVRPALEDSLRRGREELGRGADAPALDPVLVPEARRASLEGRPHVAAARMAAALRGGEHDAVLLANFSLAPAAEALRQLIPQPVLTTPEAAARLLADALEDETR